MSARPPLAALAAAVALLPFGLVRAQEDAHERLIVRIENRMDQQQGTLDQIRVLLDGALVQAASDRLERVRLELTQALTALAGRMTATEQAHQESVAKNGELAKELIALRSEHNALIIENRALRVTLDQQADLQRALHNEMAQLWSEIARLKEARKATDETKPPPKEGGDGK